MKKLLAVGVILVLGALIYSRVRPGLDQVLVPPTQTSSSDDSPDSGSGGIVVLAKNLDTPWGLAVLPDGGILVTERPGRVRLIDTQGSLVAKPVATLSSVREIGEGGLLGIALHPNFATNHFVYLYYTYSASGDNTMNRVVRQTYVDGALSDEQIIVDQIPGASNHNGGRIQFGPDNNLYIGTGDAQEPSQAQNTGTLGGKILRVTDTGDAASGNPFDNRVYTYGHRNVQGLAWDANGNLWSTEHGRSGIASGLDEINLIQSGKNYGWPDIEGTKAKSGMEVPKANSGATTTWAPAGMAFLDESLYFAGLRGQSLYQAKVNGQNVSDIASHLSSEYGRIRDVVVGPNNTLYITTSNQDGRGSPASDDDRVLRVSVSSL